MKNNKFLEKMPSADLMLLQINKFKTNVLPATHLRRRSQLKLTKLQKVQRML